MEEGSAKKKGGGPFERLGLSKDACEAARGLGYNLPTPIQRKAIPAILSQSGDVLANARTGSGKTAAFLLPAITRLESHSSIVGARCLVILPTRELALQTGLVLRKMLKGAGRGSDASTLRICYLIGGMSMAKQFEHLSSNPDFLVCTPGRLVHHMVEAEFKLTRVEMAIFDEGDLLFEMGFEDDVSKILKAMASCVKKQIVIASATLPSQLVQFARARLQNPQYIYLDAEQSLPDTLELQLYYIRQADKTAALLFWLENVMPQDSQCIIFCATVHHVSYLAEVLSYYQRKALFDQDAELHYRSIGCLFRGGPFSCTQLSGQLSQSLRDDAMKDFVQKKTRILLATDVAARGVDIDKLEYVVHYSFPSSPKLFVHRSGRAARKGQKGVCVSFVCREEFPYLMELLLFIGRKLKVESANTVTEEIERFSFDFGFGDDVESVTSAKASADTKNQVDVGGLPDLNDYREAVAAALLNDAGIASLAKSMAGGEKQYMKHRQPASKQSLRRSAKVLELLGGTGQLADSIHPLLQATYQSMLKANKMAGSKFSNNALFENYKNEIKEESKHNIPEPEEVLQLDALRSFRPSASKKAGKGIGVAKEVFNQMEEKRCEKRALKYEVEDRMNEINVKTAHKDEGTHSEDAKSVEVAVSDNETHARKPRMSAAKRRRQRVGDHKTKSVRQQQLESLNEYSLDATKKDEAVVAKEIGLSLNSGVQMESASFGILAEDTKLEKPKRAVKWNASKKKYENVEVDRRTGRKIRNDAGALVETKNKGLYKRWASSNQKRIQQAGEVEDEQLTNDFVHKRQQQRNKRFGLNREEGEVPLAPLSELTKDKGLLEKLDRRIPLNEREQRKYKRLLKRQANPIVTA